MIKALISAYACEPNCGSEPEVGWRVATGMATHCDVCVITRANNQEGIEAEFENYTGRKPKFLYYDLPSIFLKLKKNVLGTGGYYFLWQLAIRWKFRTELRESHLVHHVTFNGVQLPGFWLATQTPVVLGPLGGGMVCPPHLLPLIKQGRNFEKFRTWCVKRLSWFPWWKPLISGATTVIAANRETADLLQPYRASPVRVMLETAAPATILDTVPSSKSPNSTLNVLWLGNLMPRKAPILAIKVIAEVLKSFREVRLVIAGAGPEEERLKQEVTRLGLQDHVFFAGKIPKADVTALMDSADAFLFTSIRDTSGNVVIEAMSRGLPVVAINHQGVREICDRDSALLVEPGTPHQVTAEMAEMLVRLGTETDFARKIGQAGRLRVKTHLTWESFYKRMHSIYTMAAQCKKT